MIHHDPIKLYRTGEPDVAWSLMNYLLSLGRAKDLLSEFRHQVGLRCKRNLDILVSSLVDRGFVFCENNGQHCERALSEVWKKPNADSGNASRALSERYGNAGYLVHTWIEEVGDININGYFRAWEGLIEADPLWIEFQTDSYADYFDSEILENEDPWILADYQLTFSPDSLHKADISGSSGPAINLPAGIPEGAVQIGLKGISFRDYLNSYFECGGFLALPHLKRDGLSECDFIAQLASRMLKV